MTKITEITNDKELESAVDKAAKKIEEKYPDEDMMFIGTKEIARYMGCSVPVARQVMHRKDFPLVKCGKNLRVMKREFIRWASERRL